MSTLIHELVEVDSPAPIPEVSVENGYQSSKRWLDTILTCVILPISVPFILLAWILVKLTSKGPGFYAQERLGQRGKIFTIYKIRTMYEDSEREGPRWCTPGDSRITPIGQILRMTHVDELPQLWNILWGDMSLVGPRPERPQIVSQLERALPNYRRRLQIPAGLTGLAQVQQPPDTDLESVRCKLEYDLCYAERMNLWLDLRLMAATFLKCLGFSFASIRWALRLPNPNTQFRDSFLHDLDRATTTFASDSCVS